MKETEIQKQILDYLRLKKVFCYRQNSGAFKTQSGHFYRFGTAGSPDIIAVINGKYIGIEVKLPKGRQSQSQKDFQKQLENAGGEYILARNLSDIISKFVCG